MKQNEPIAMELRALEDYQNPQHEMRVEEADGKPRLVGYAVRWNSLSKDIGGFYERILPGAFDAAFANGADVRMLFDHDKSKLLGRTTANTLRIGKDESGLYYSVDLPDTTYARDMVALVKRGDIAGNSFGFKVKADRLVRDNGLWVREVITGELKELTITSIPAYADTTLQLRVDPSLAGRIPADPLPATVARNAARRRLTMKK